MPPPPPPPSHTHTPLQHTVSVRCKLPAGCAASLQCALGIVSCHANATRPSTKTMHVHRRRIQLSPSRRQGTSSVKTPHAQHADAARPARSMQTPHAQQAAATCAARIHAHRGNAAHPARSGRTLTPTSHAARLACIHRTPSAHMPHYQHIRHTPSTHLPHTHPTSRRCHTSSAKTQHTQHTYAARPAHRRGTSSGRGGWCGAQG